MRKPSHLGNRTTPWRLLGVVLGLILATQLPVGALPTDSQGGTGPELAGDTLGVATKLTTTPTSPITRDLTNPRYFNYGGQTVALVGISGETIPHLAVPTQFPDGTHAAESYCTYDLISGSTRKYQNCLSVLQAAGINKIRLWIDFNGKMTPVSAPTDHHQPFKYGVCASNPAKTAWDLNLYDATYFSNLSAVVNYAQSHGIIVEVTLFVPTGSDAAAQAGPWWSTNNCQGIGFRNPTTPTTENSAYFHQADNTSTNPLTAANLDSDTVNRQLRTFQVNLVNHVIDTLTNFNNVYWELANEADFSGTTLSSLTYMVNWHEYVARRIYEHETALGRHHMIAVDTGAGASLNLEFAPHIDILNSHYVKLVGNRQIGSNPNGLPESDRFSAIKLLLHFNLYWGGVPDGMINLAMWGFNETHITGLAGGSLAATPDSARAEAWQFMVDGGSVYDHLSYCWGNLAPFSSNGTCAPMGQTENPDAVAARTQLGLLSRFLGGLPLPSMVRSMPDPMVLWVSAPTDISPDTACNAANTCWSAMESSDVKLLYLHHSGLSTTGGFRRYAPIKKSPSLCPTSCLTNPTSSCLANCYAEQFSVTNQGSTGGTYKAEWFTPNGTYVDGAGANLVPIPVAPFSFAWAPGQTVQLPRNPPYDFDLVLKLTRTGP
jgi:hypothetical protein